MPRASPLSYGVAGTWASLAERVVVDASALLPLVLPDTPDRVNYAVAVVERVAGGALDLVIPQICHLELSAVIARKMRGGALQASVAKDFFEQLDGLGFEQFVETFRYGEFYARAMALNCQVADAVYVTLAAQLGLALATLDGGMRQAARQAGVQVYVLR